MSMTSDNDLIGTWKLKTYIVEIQSTGQKIYPMGLHPQGYAIFTANGRVMFVLTGEGRIPAKTDADMANLHKTIVSYTGPYRIEGDQWVTSIEVAWNPEWVGTEQRRHFQIHGNEMLVTTTWRVMPNWQEWGMQRSILTFEKEQ